MISPPKPATLKKYGLSEDAWRAILDSQGGVCFVCKRVPGTGRFCTDHEHVKNWKKMPPEQRVLYVRGLLCWTCNNYYLARGITVERAKNVVLYLENYLNKRPV